eukprot:Seg435.12 transcript_id=Seg435.12/GoldUCD/mRNA.D3Y31 product="Methionine aminopeptidase 1" protein_id=Seg435.12/GoldUCD/D3Y31
MADKVCESPGCEKPAKLQCPTCLKLGIVEGSFFCEQECFKSSWKTHKAIHKQVQKNDSISNGVQKTEESSENYNPYPGYMYTGKLKPFPLSEKRTVPLHIGRPDYADHPKGYPASEMSVKRSTSIQVLTPSEIESMREVCRLAREVLDIGAKAVKVGITADEIDRIVHEATVERNCYPSPLNYSGFPKSCCTSVNEVICHGIPDKRPLENGDIVNLDITCYYKGFHGDLNETLFVGEVDDASKNLVKTAYECMMSAIHEIKPGVRYRELGNFIQKHAHTNGCAVTKTYCGHGIHRLFHTAPNIPHYAKNKAVGIMKPGHVFTVEPMINQGTWRDNLWDDGWTAVTQDGKRSAQFEQTLLVTETGVDILTKRPDNDGRPHFMDQLEAMGEL